MNIKEYTANEEIVLTYFNNFTIKYGIKDNNIDVTDVCRNKCIHNGILTILSGDHERTAIFGDPLPYVLKSIFIQSNNDNRKDNSVLNNPSYTVKHPQILFYNGIPYNRNNPDMKRIINQNLFHVYRSIYQDEIIENLWVGCKKSKDYLRCFHFKINMAADVKKVPADIHERIYDNQNYNNAMYSCFDRITLVIDQNIITNRRVLVFCHQGFSRSATMVVAYLMRYKNMTKNNAIDLVRNKRRGSLPDIPIFDVALSQWEEYCKNIHIHKYTNTQI